MCGLSTVWVNPHQARVSTMEEVIRELTALASQWTQLALHLGVDQ